MSDDKIEAIRARHNDATWRYYELPNQMHDDRAFLLAEVDRLSSDLRVQQGCCDGAAAQDAHIRREREEHKAEVEKLLAENERLRAENDKLRELAFLVERRTTGTDTPVVFALEGKP